MLCYIILYVLLYYIILYYTISYYLIFYERLYYFILYYTMRYDNIRHCTILCDVILSYTTAKLPTKILRFWSLSQEDLIYCAWSCGKSTRVK